MNPDANMTQHRFDRLDQYIAEGRVLRRKWADTDVDGRERACLLVALAPEVGSMGDIDACPATLLPPWLAYLTPSLDDSIGQATWLVIVKEYARVVRMGVTTLDDDGWNRVKARFLLAVLKGVRAKKDPSPGDDKVATLWRRVLAGDEPAESEWASALRGVCLTMTTTAKAAARAGGAATLEKDKWVERAASSAWVEWTAPQHGRDPMSFAWNSMSYSLFAAIEAECSATRTL